MNACAIRLALDRLELKTNLRYNICTALADGSLIVPSAVLKPWTGSPYETTIEQVMKELTVQLFTFPFLSLNLALYPSPSLLFRKL